MFFYQRVFICVVGLSCGLYAEETEYALSAKKEGTVPITQVQFFGERCSGTNYLEALVLKNFNFNPPYYSFGWKHFPVWLDGDWFQTILPEYGGNPFLQKNDQCLFIVVFRDPYDWLRSFYEKPYHASKQFKKTVDSNFTRFIKTPWDAEEKLQYIESNPVDGSRFKNVMKLRSARIRNMLGIGEIVANIYYVQYEMIRDYPEEVMQEIADFFGIKTSKSFVPVTEYYKGGRVKEKTFKERKYFGISKEDLIYINKYLDADLESRIGYELSN